MKPRVRIPPIARCDVNATQCFGFLNGCRSSSGSCILSSFHRTVGTMTGQEVSLNFPPIKPVSVASNADVAQRLVLLPSKQKTRVRLPSSARNVLPISIVFRKRDMFQLRRQILLSFFPCRRNCACSPTGRGSGLKIRVLWVRIPPGALPPASVETSSYQMFPVQTGCRLH